MARALVAAFVLLAISALPAFAGKPEHAGKGKGKGKSYDASSASGYHVVDKEKSPGRGDDDYEVFTIRHRDVVRVYYTDSYGRGHCPPGLAKKNNGCLPPGLAKKRYAIGEPLPAGIVIAPIPIALAGRLGSPPYGYRYGIVDGDVVKLALGTLLIVDAIDGLVD
jgi:hypothetical protein